MTGPAADQAVGDALRRLYRERAAGPPEASLTALSWRPEGVRRRHRRRFVRLDADGVPVLVAKLPTAPGDDKPAGEYRVLGSLGPGLAVGRPRAIGRVGRGFAMTYVPGVDLADHLRRCWTPGAFRAALFLAVDVMVRLHTTPPAGAAVRPSGPEAASGYVEEPIADPPHLAEALERAFVGPTHGDLGPWNVHFDPVSGQVAVLDWEDYRPAGVAAVDLLNLLLTSGLVAFPEYRERGYDWLYDRLFHGRGWLRECVWDCLIRYAAATLQDPGRLLDLTPFFCQWLLTRIRREGRDPGDLFYEPFLHNYRSEPVGWVRSVDRR
jgi:hypothetical protein